MSSEKEILVGASAPVVESLHEALGWALESEPMPSDVTDASDDASQHAEWLQRYNAWLDHQREARRRFIGLAPAREVWLIEGWFGSDEWIEGVYATEAEAEARIDSLDRTSERFPDKWPKLCKFAAERYQVVASATAPEALPESPKSLSREGTK